MSNEDFWESIHKIIDSGYSPEGLKKLEYYADLFYSGKLLFKRFSSQEQRGCAAGGWAHVIASILSGAEVAADPGDEKLTDFKREIKQGEKQAQRIEKWAKRVGLWIENVDSQLTESFGKEIAEGGEAKVYDNGPKLIKSIGLDYYLYPNLALDRISLHNAYFPETALNVIGFGRDELSRFKVVVEQTYIVGKSITESEIQIFLERLGFKPRNLRNWTYSTPEIYLSDMHDENVIRSESGNVFVIDCDIRINTPDLHQGGEREYTSEVLFL